MFKQHPVVETPDINAVIWRYLDFTKFVSLLHSRSLFFPSIKSLRESDPYEGYLPMVDSSNSSSDQVSITHTMNEPFNESTAVSCWYMSDTQSAAMWKLYGDSIAIQTTVGVLIDSLTGFQSVNEAGILVDVDFYVGTVQYSPANDYEEARIPYQNAISGVLHKRKSFQHEQEMRVIVNFWPGPQVGIDTRLPFFIGSGKRFPDLEAQLKINNGIYFPLKLHQLIHRIYVSPTLPRWVTGTVEAVCRKYDLGVSVEQSNLMLSPLY